MTEIERLREALLTEAIKLRDRAHDLAIATLAPPLSLEAAVRNAPRADRARKAFDDAVSDLCPIVDAYRAALAATPPGEWKLVPVEPDLSQAPWDGEAVLIATDHSYGSRVHRAIWTNAIHGGDIYGWAVEDLKHGPFALRGYLNVTHWQPLPAPPPPASEGEK